MTYVLYVLVYAGLFAKGDSVALVRAERYVTKEACMQVGNQLKPLVQGTTKELVFVCVKEGN